MTEAAAREEWSPFCILNSKKPKVFDVQILSLCKVNSEVLRPSKMILPTITLTF